MIKQMEASNNDGNTIICVKSNSLVKNKDKSIDNLKSE